MDGHGIKKRMVGFLIYGPIPHFKGDVNTEKPATIFGEMGIAGKEWWWGRGRLQDSFGSGLAEATYRTFPLAAILSSDATLPYLSP